MSDRRSVLEAVAFGVDARITPGDRLRAVDALRDLDVKERRSVVAEDLSPEQAREEMLGLRDAIDACLIVADGPDAVRPPAECEADVLRQHIAVVEEDRDLAFAERDRIMRAARDAFGELFGDREPDAQAVIRAWKEMREPPPEAEVVAEELPGGSQG